MTGKGGGSSPLLWEPIIASCVVRSSEASCCSSSTSQFFKSKTIIDSSSISRLGTGGTGCAVRLFGGGGSCFAFWRLSPREVRLAGRDTREKNLESPCAGDRRLIEGNDVRSNVNFELFALRGALGVVGGSGS